mgnify:CR=1 FL=1
MPNMSPTKVPMPQQDPNVRNKNFEEVATGYTAEMAMEEATRCINCKNRPCMTGCPVNVPIPGFIEQVAAGNFEKAYEIITSENALPAICGRVCPQENQCEGKCIRGIKGESVSIGRLERVDLRSYARQGLDIIPTVHEGAAVRQMEKRGIQTNIGNLNRKSADQAQGWIAAVSVCIGYQRDAESDG